MYLYFILLPLVFSLKDSLLTHSEVLSQKDTNSEKDEPDSSNQADSAEEGYPEENPPVPIQNSLFDDPNPLSLFVGQWANANSTSKEAENGALKYDAEYALTRGSHYWKSESNLDSNEKIKFIVTFKLPKMVGGTDIEWVKHPLSYSISCLYGHDEDENKWEKIASNITGDATYTKFNDFHRCNKIMFSMIPEDYIAIRSIRFVGEPDVLFRIQSGITSLQDMCLQVDDTGEVVLSSCLIPIAMNSGVDIFKFNVDGQIYSPVLDKCVVVKSSEDPLVDNSVVMGNCSEYLNKCCSIWTLTPQNQLVINKPGRYCLSQKGSKAGYIDVAMSKLVSSSDDVSDFPPYNAVDGNPTTKWESRTFPSNKPPTVTLTIDLMEVYKIERIEILWDSAPLTYEILASNKAENSDLLEDFKKITEVKSNILSYTHDEVGGIKCQVIKIVMRNGLADPSSSHSSYGIRSITILSNRLTTIVEECDVAEKSFDTRDKYFFESIYEVELHKLDSAKLKLNTLISSIEQLTSKLDHLPIEACRRDIIQKSEKLESLERDFELISHDLNKFNYTQIPKSDVLGISPDNPGRDCMEIKNYNPKNPSGFYYIRPECHTNSTRAYCDMKMGETYLLVDINNDSVEAFNSGGKCKELGLDLLKISDPSQVIGIQHMFQMMNISSDSLYPIAFISDNKFISLDLEFDSSDALKSLVTASSGDNTVVISLNEVKSIDATKKEMSGLICSFYGSSMKSIDCFTNMNSITHSIDNEFLFSCPGNCLAESSTSTLKLVGGFETVIATDETKSYKALVFTLDSPICLAAAALGNRFVKAKIVEGLPKYSGLVANGIVVEAGQGKPGEYAIALFDPCKQTKPEKAKPHAVEGKKDAINREDVKPVAKTSVAAAKTHTELTAANSHTQQQMGQVIRLFEKSIQAISDSFTNLLVAHINNTLYKTKGVLTPTIFTLHRNKNSLNQLEKNFQHVQLKLDLASAHMVNQVKQSHDKYIKAKINYDEHTAFTSWSIKNVHNFNIEFGYLGTGVWELNDLVVQFSNNQQSYSHMLIDKNNSICVKRYKNLFDFIFVTTVIFTGDGSAGLIVRFQNPTNYYLVELIKENREKGGERYNRLVRMQDGVAHELARFTINDDSENQNHVRTTVRIEARRERLGISFLKDINDIYSTPHFDINVVDDGLLSGTFGFMTSSLPIATFSDVNIEALNCINDIYTPPIPKSCTTYKVNDIIADDWISIPPSKIEVLTLQWDANEGKSRSLVLRDIEEQKFYLLSNRVSCLYGTFQFHMLMQCSDGFAGGVVRFSNANNYIEFLTSGTKSKLVQVSDGVPHELATSSSSVKAGRWYKVKIIMVGKGDELYISVFMNEKASAEDFVHPSKSIFSISTSLLNKYKHKLFTVGLTNSNCKAAAFTSVSLEAGPVNESHLTPLTPPASLSKEGANLLSICVEHSANICSGDIKCCKACCITAQGYSMKAAYECQHYCTTPKSTKRINSEL